jgi:hypothetical protein
MLRDFAAVRKRGSAVNRCYLLVVVHNSVLSRRYAVLVSVRLCRKRLDRLCFLVLFNRTLYSITLRSTSMDDHDLRGIPHFCCKKIFMKL